MDRKEFIRIALTAMAGLTVRPSPGSPDDDAPKKPPLPRRKLGENGPQVTALGLGGFHLGKSASEKEARAIIDAALEEGIAFFDTAESYQNGQSERYLGAGLSSVRPDVFLMSKTFDLETRSRETAERHLAGTLERLRTDHLDLWQLHSVRSPEDVDHAFRDGGAMEYILEQQAKGVVRHVGVTGHADPKANLRALHHFDQGRRFDCMQFPLNPIDYHQKSFQKELLPELVKRKIGILAMKTSADGRLLREKLCTMDETLRFALTLPVSCAIVGMESVEQVRENCARVRRFEAYSKEALEALFARLEPKADLALEWYKG